MLDVGGESGPAIGGLADRAEQSSEHRLADRCADRCAEGADKDAASQSCGALERHRPHHRRAEMLLHFGDERRSEIPFDGDGLVDRGQGVCRKPHIDDRAVNGDDLAHSSVLCCTKRHSSIPIPNAWEKPEARKNTVAGARTALIWLKIGQIAGEAYKSFIRRLILVKAAGLRTDDHRRLRQWRTIVKALVYQGPGRKALEERPMPEIKMPTDAIVKIVRTTICGTDLHILKGDVPTCAPGRILGHEGVGVVATAGPGVTTFRPGDRVLISCISACGRCDYCRRGMYSHCTTGGWILGNAIDGTQAEYARIPHADTSLYRTPEGVDEEALVMLSDILPTGFECGVLNGKVVPGSTVAIVGAGPIGLAALLTAQFYSPAEIIAIDLDDGRLAVAERFGATATVNAGGGKAVETIMKMTGGRGVDTAIEAVGVPASFITCEDIVAPGGIIANIGVHGAKVDLHLERLWAQNITITTRLVDTVTTPMLLKIVQARKIDPTRLITHRFKLDRILDAYETFGHAASTQALKVIIAAGA